jgi:hypothetical protein
VICSYIVDLQWENKSKSKRYKLLAKMNPGLDDPLASFYEEFVIKDDESYKNATKLQKKAEKELTTTAQALTELSNKQTHVHLEI